jgi:hypothetical protein
MREAGFVADLGQRNHTMEVRKASKGSRGRTTTEEEDGDYSAVFMYVFPAHPHPPGG